MKVVQYCRGRHYKFCNGQWNQRLSIGKKGIIPKFCPPRPKTELYFQYGGANSIHFEEDTTMQAKSLGRGGGWMGGKGLLKPLKNSRPWKTWKELFLYIWHILESILSSPYKSLSSYRTAKDWRYFCWSSQYFLILAFRITPETLQSSKNPPPTNLMNYLHILG